MAFGKRLKQIPGKVKDGFKRLAGTSHPATSDSSSPNAPNNLVNSNPALMSSTTETRHPVTVPDPHPTAQHHLPIVNPESPPQVTNEADHSQSNEQATQLQVAQQSTNVLFKSTDDNDKGQAQAPDPTNDAPTSAPDTNPTTPFLFIAHEDSRNEEGGAHSRSVDPAIKSKTTGRSGASSGAWDCLSSFRKGLDRVSNGFGPLKPVLDDLIDFIDVYQDAAEAQQEYAELKSDLEALFRTLSAHFFGDAPLAMTAGMNNLCIAIKAELDKISIKEERGRGRRFLEANKDIQDVMNCYRCIQGHLERLKLNADLNMWKVVDEIAAENRLKSLLPSLSACHDSAEALSIGRRECTPETRKQVLSDLLSWIRNEEQMNVYWLNGMAGTGKTTIANSLCAMLHQSHELAASFFCSRTLPECRNVKLILPTIAYQLACYSRPFYHALSLAIQQDRDLHTKVPSSQFAGLIVGPLRQVAHALPAGLVVVVDALDECEDRQGVGQLLEILVRHATDLPIKLFISSRPEPQIRQKIGETKSQLILHELEDSIVKEDIKLYLYTELCHLNSFISDADFATLVARAGVLFIYAATVVRYIKSATSSPLQRKRVQGVLGTNSPGYLNKNKDIDSLYTIVLASAFENPDLEDAEKEIMKLVLDSVVCVQEPLTVDGLAGILGLEDGTWVQAALEPLWSVIHVSGEENVVSTLHASFADYMLDPTRSRIHGCQRQQHHDRLAELCFNRINGNQLLFNLCNLESSFIVDDEVGDLEERIRQAIPPDLAYACCYWAIHLQLGGYSDGRLGQLQTFLSGRLLLWMEVLNLKRKISTSASMLATARIWCQESIASQNIKELLHDAWRFATTFATGDIRQSTPHLYISMLASWPDTSPLAYHYLGRTTGLASIRGPGMNRRQRALLSAFVAGGSVREVAVSPNGMQIASGSADMKICIWDATNGKLMMDPLEGHTSQVLSVAFSPNGTYIASGSEDNTIRVWDVTNGKAVTGSLKKYTSAIHSVAFSPKDMRIVSGSEDGTIQIWGIIGGDLIMGPLMGHTGAVYSVEFSPDGRCIASGSEDCAVRMWDATHGHSLMEPLEGHSEAVLSVAFSPDGMRLVSGSYDTTICVWDATSGDLVMGPLEEHINVVSSVAFSPDGKRIVSGSRDNEIRVWDATNGQQATEPLVGVADWVNSVTFSPDGMRIYSGSGDKMIRVWDAKSVKAMTSPLKSHTASVNSVAFSPDGKRVATGSGDGLICVWDAISGDLMMDPLEGHTARIFPVAFSPDGTRIVSGASDGTVRVWDSTSGEQATEILVGYNEEICSAIFSPDGTRIVCGANDNAIRVLDVMSGELVIELLNLKEGSAAETSSDSMRIVPDSNRAETPSREAMSGDSASYPVEEDLNSNSSHSLQHTHIDPLSEMEDDASSEWWARSGLVFSVACSPDGTRIASGSSDGSIYVWDITSGRQATNPLEGHTDAIYSVAYSPDGTRVASGSGDKTIRVWDAKSGVQLMDPLEGHTEEVRSVAFSPDGTLIASGANDNTIRVRDASSGKEVMEPLEGHADSVNSVAFSPDGSLIVSGSLDATVRMWNVGMVMSQLGSRELSSQAVNRPWTLDKKGWVRDDQQRLLLWIPPDLRSRVLRSQDLFLIWPHGTVELDIEGANIGESWVNCYIPA